MSDTSQGEGWWQSGNGKWYAPEYAPQGEPANSGHLALGTTQATHQGQAPYPGQGQAPYPGQGMYPGAYPAPGFSYGQPGQYPPGGVAAPRTNGLAVASLVLSL